MKSPKPKPLAKAVKMDAKVDKLMPVAQMKNDIKNDRKLLASKVAKKGNK